MALKTLIRKLYIPVLILALLCSCNKQVEDIGPYGTFIFYKQSTSGSYSVYINNIYYGDVPYNERTPACNTTEGLRLRFAPGSYWVDVRNNSSSVYVPPVQVTIDRDECKLYRVQ